MQIARRTLFEGELLSVGHIVARPASAACGEVERQSTNVVVFPLAGVFAKHEGPRKHVVATPNHAVFIGADAPYRISYPGGIGDECLTIRAPSATLAQVLSPSASRSCTESTSVASSRLLSPSVMLARSLLWRKLVRGHWDPVEVEEAGIDLLASTLSSEVRAGRGAVNGGLGSNRRARWVESIKEAISLAPERKWTLADLAGLANVSPYHLAHIFRVEVGASVYRYVLRARLAKALDAVLDDDANLTHIALATGFASHSHFTARFHALFGLTPGELRRRASSRKAAQLRKIVTAPALAAD